MAIHWGEARAAMMSETSRLLVVLQVNPLVIPSITSNYPSNPLVILLVLLVLVLVVSLD